MTSSNEDMMTEDLNFQSFHNLFDFQYVSTKNF